MGVPRFELDRVEGSRGRFDVAVPEVARARMFLAEDLNGSNVADDVHCFVRELTVEIARSTLRVADESSAPDDDDGEQRYDGQRRELRARDR